VNPDRVVEALFNGLKPLSVEISDYDKALDYAADAFISDNAFSWVSSRIAEIRNVAGKTREWAQMKVNNGALLEEDARPVLDRCDAILTSADTCLARAEAPRLAQEMDNRWPSSWSGETMDIVLQYGEADAGPILQPLKELEKKRADRWPWTKVKAGLTKYCEAGKLQYGIRPFVRDIEHWTGNGHQPKRGRDGCELAANAVPEVIVSRIEMRRRIAEGTKRLLGESLQDHLTRVEDKLRDLEAP